MSTNEALSTLEAGPFEKPGNGYFSVWGLAICSGIAADPPGSLKRANFNSLLNLGAASLVVVLSLLPYVVHGSDNAVEVFICLSVAGLSIMTSSMFCLLKLCTWRSNHGNGGGQAVISTIIAILWIGKLLLDNFRDDAEKQKIKKVLNPIFYCILSFGLCFHLSWTFQERRQWLFCFVVCRRDGSKGSSIGMEESEGEEKECNSLNIRICVVVSCERIRKSRVNL